MRLEVLIKNKVCSTGVYSISLVIQGGGRKNKDDFRKFRKDKVKKQVYPPNFEDFEVKER